MPGVQDTGFNPFISIVGGKFRQKVDEGTSGAVRREYELKNGEKGVKHELVFRSWKGIIEDIRVVDGEYGEVCHVVFPDATISIPTASRYFLDFAKKARNINTDREIELIPYDFEDNEGQRRTGISVLQEGKKQENFYWDAGKKTTKNDFPKVDEKEYKKLSGTRLKEFWRDYYGRTVKNFLVDEISKIKFAPKSTVITEQDLHEAGLIDENTIAEQVEKVPF